MTSTSGKTKRRRPSRRERDSYRLRAMAYARHYNNIPRGRFEDGYDYLESPNGQRRSFTLACYGPQRQICGTIRLLVAWQRQRHTQWRGEIGTLMRLESGPPGSLQQAFMGLPSVQGVAEFGKLALDRDAPDKSGVFKCLIRRVATRGRRLGLNVGLFMLSSGTARVLLGARIPIKRVKGVVLDRLRSENLRYFVRFADYFMPKLARRLSPDIRSACERMSPEELRALTRTIPDGVHLYYFSQAHLPMGE